MSDEPVRRPDDGDDQDQDHVRGDLRTGQLPAPAEHVHQCDQGRDDHDRPDDASADPPPHASLSSPRRAAAASQGRSRSRSTSSATQIGRSPPSRSTVVTSTACSPPVTGSTDSTTNRALIRLPAGSGDGKRTRFTP